MSENILISEQIIPFSNKELKDQNIQLFTNKNDEIKFFLREYRAFENEKFDFYYIIPYPWIKNWDTYISDQKSNK
jgi:hypothetical protein